MSKFYLPSKLIEWQRHFRWVSVLSQYYIKGLERLVSRGKCRLVKEEESRGLDVVGFL